MEKKRIGQTPERTAIDGKERILVQGGLDADVVSQRKSARTRIQELEE